jgi:S-adenosylmethionine decarboxylase
MALTDHQHPDDSSSNEGVVPDEISGVMFNSEQSQSYPIVEFPDDDGSGSGELREYTGHFEGPEKTLEICFRKKDEEGPAVTKPGERAGLRRLTKSQLDRICARARCTILSSISNQYLDAYVLSESSLFVYPYMFVLKTCGTTTLLRCIALLIDFGGQLGLEIDWVGYSRKNFNFPGDQAFPHQVSFGQQNVLVNPKILRQHF